MKIKSGIYKITNIKTLEFYIGSAVCFYHRKEHHFRQLKQNKHHNIKLQNSYNKNGVANFKFEIIEYVEDKTKLIEREQYYLDTLKPHYNICKIAGSCLNRRPSKETKAKIAKSSTGKKQSAETVEKRVSKLRGKTSKLKDRKRPKEIGGNHSIFMQKYWDEIPNEKRKEFGDKMKGKGLGWKRPHTIEEKEKIGVASRLMWARIKQEKLTMIF